MDWWNSFLSQFSSLQQVGLLFFAINVVFCTKHFLADYPLQTPYMLKKFGFTWEEWVLPLSAHAGVHALFTFSISFLFTRLWSVSLGLAAFDFSIHFVMDRIKASPNLLGRYKALSANEMKIWTQHLIIPEEPSAQFRTYRARNQALSSNKKFWWALGFDQYVHHLTDLVSAFVIFYYLPCIQSRLPELLKVFASF